VQVNDRHLFVGKHAFQAYRKALHQHWGLEIAGKLREGYAKAAEFLLKNLPLENRNIMGLSCMNPAAVQEQNCMSSMLKLAEMLPNVVTEREVEQLDEELREFIEEPMVKTTAAGFNSEVDCIVKDFWVRVFKPEYCLLSKLVKALLSVFCGPSVEATFNIMDDIITKDRSKLEPENYEAASFVRSVVKQKYRTAVNMPASKTMTGYIKRSKTRYQSFQRLKEKSVSQS
jgi:hypothetical protein